MGLLGIGNFEGARSACNEAVVLAPTEALGYYCQGRIARAEGRYGEAQTALEQALGLNASLVEARGTLGDVLTASGDLAGGEIWLRDALAHAESHNRHAGLAENLFAQGSFEEAAAEWSSALVLAPGNAGYLANIARCAQAMGDTSLAYTSMLAARDEDPENPTWHVALVDMANALQDYAQAVQFAELGITAFPSHPDLNMGLCRATVRAQRWQDAEIACVRAGGMAPSGSEAQSMLGVIYMGTERWQEARTVLEAAVANGAEDVATHVNLGMVLLRSGETADARARFAAALTLDENTPLAHYYQGMCAADLGDNEAATIAACRAAELAPTDARFGVACREGRFE